MLKTGLIPNCDPKALQTIQDLSTVNSERLSDLFGGNSGNLAYVHGIQKLIGTETELFSWDQDPSWVKDNIDRIVVSCANQLGPHSDLSLWADRLSSFQKPVTLIGLGAQSPSTLEMPVIPEGTLRFLDVVRSLAEHDSINIASRGNYSSEVLAKHGYQSSPAGCPSVLIREGAYIADQMRSRMRVNQLRVAVAAGNPWVKDTSILEKRLISMLDNTSRSYIIQHPAQLLALALGKTEPVSAQDQSDISDWLGLEKTTSALSAWFGEHSRVFTNVNDWINSLESFDLVIGTRFHGVCLGVQAGAMGTVISIDSRTQELCETTGVKYLTQEEAKELNPEELLLRARWSEKDLDNLLTRQKNVAKDLSHFLQNNRVKCSAYAEGLRGWHSQK